MDFMPDLWGEGQLLAFSGVDGVTRATEPLVLTTAVVDGALRLRLPLDLAVGFDGLRVQRWTCVLGDALVGEADGGPYRLAFADHHTVVGEVPSGVRVTVGEVSLSMPPCRLARVGEGDLVGWQDGTAWGLAWRTPGDGDLAPVPVRPDLAALCRERAGFVRAVEASEELTPGQFRLLRKAVSVMKVNLYSAEGPRRRRWSTPDRWPHRHMWLWDSAFHAVGMAYVDLGLAQDEILAMLEAITPEGMLPHMVQADGGHSAITQPPLLAWSTRHVMDLGGDPSWARECLPLLERYLDWDRRHRDRNGNGLPEWQISGEPLCRCGESGLDNSSVYDRGVLLDAPDFAAFLYNDYECLADLAERLGDEALAERCHRAADPVAVAVNASLWLESAGLYAHLDHDGGLLPIKTIAGFMPLFAGIATTDRAARLAGHLSNPATFGAPVQVPSEALDSGTFCKDMWRGPAWVNLSYLVVLGLRRYGFSAEAEALKENLLETVQRWYEREGCLFEYYDALGLTSPRDLDRKRRLGTGRGIAPICDYHWTAAVTAALLLE
ncbi:MAG: hypothetical protein GX595_05410 [Lentisphaerae bacterium]|nr:hypothetical protein [Lentisphaerota bacterium]